MKQKKYYAHLLILLVALLASFSFVRAEDDEYENDDDEEEVEQVQDEKKPTVPKNTVQVITIPAKTITRTVMKDVILIDSDRDGLFDENDPHPSIAEIYIVFDENRNGIADQYEVELP